MSTDTESVARSYILAVGAHDLASVERLLADRLVATFAGAPLDKAAWLGALGRLLPALTSNDIVDVFTNGDRACVVYDFVTNTAGGTVRCVELLTVEDGEITTVQLILDRVAFAPVNEELARRAAQA